MWIYTVCRKIIEGQETKKVKMLPVNLTLGPLGTFTAPVVVNSSFGILECKSC